MTLLTTAFAQGTHAARPAAAAGNNGFYYYETDTTNLFQSTGSAWQQIASQASGGGIPTGGAASQVVGYGGSSGTGAWVYPPGFEIGYTQITTSVAVTATSEASGTTIISPGALTFDGGAVMVEFWAIEIETPTGGVDQVVRVCLFEGATEITRLVNAWTENTSSARTISASGKYRFTPSAASHTYTVTAFATNTTGTPTIVAGSGGTAGQAPAFVRFTKV